jgi:hypothetical protein
MPGDALGSCRPLLGIGNEVIFGGKPANANNSLRPTITYNSSTLILGI